MIYLVECDGNVNFLIFIVGLILQFSEEELLEESAIVLGYHQHWNRNPITLDSEKQPKITY